MIQDCQSQVSKLRLFLCQNNVWRPSEAQKHLAASLNCYWNIKHFPFNCFSLEVYIHTHTHNDIQYRKRNKESYPTLFTCPVIWNVEYWKHLKIGCGEDVVSFIKYSYVHLCANVKLVFGWDLTFFKHVFFFFFEVELPLQIFSRRAKSCQLTQKWRKDT